MSQDNAKVVQIGQIDINIENVISDPDVDCLPILATRDLVLFPGVTFPISLGRESSIDTARLAEKEGIPIGIVCQKNPSKENPQIDDLYTHGVIGDIMKVFDLPDGSKTAIIHSRSRFKIVDDTTELQSEWPMCAKVQLLKDSSPRKSDQEFMALIALIKDTMTKLLKESEVSDVGFDVEQVPSPVLLVNLVASHSPIASASKIKMLEKGKIKERAYLLLADLAKTEQVVRLSSEIKEQTRRNISEQQRNAFLHQQMEVIRQELYGDDNEAEQLKKRADSVGLPKNVRKTFDREVEKLSRYNPQSPDYAVQYSYLDTLLDLPWNKYTPNETSLKRAEEVLEEDHFGLEKVKTRIIEQLAVLMNTPDGRSPIICLVGAPGVGKTSLGKSVAKALGRKYQRVSLGGMHDESEIRGHRRTYIGAMPGRIIDAIRRAGSSNPVILLDEIDKMGSDFRGDPSAALLEVLDPEQNSHFHDNYVDVDFDLSKVLFIATANTLSSISQPLLDRMEIIDLSGYLIEEKIEIARRHLLPRILEQNGFERDSITFTPEGFSALIENYTSESGVRQLEKMLSSVIRKVVRRKVSDEEFPAEITPEIIREYLGVPTFTRDRYEGNEFPGVVTGLAWTSVGGEILYVESSLSAGKGGKPTLTGNLGDVMKESAIIAHQYVMAHAEEFGIPAEMFETRSLHIHVPEGAIPKDGPSAGITMVTSIVSAYTGRKVKAGYAMTGEITLRGKVLPVGGIKEKILAAKRAGITDIVLCKANRKDIEDILPHYLEGLTFHYVDRIDEVVKEALE
ncbi:MAG: endopeptidase La [Barnesiella sp.]|nr:endopeptidase La [Barnesiella sp.]